MYDEYVGNILYAVAMFEDAPERHCVHIEYMHTILWKNVTVDDRLRIQGTLRRNVLD